MPDFECRMKGDLQMRFFVTALFVLSAVSAPVPVPDKKAEKEVMPVEIDFSPLGDVPAGVSYTLTVTIKAEDKNSHEEEYAIRSLPVERVRNLVSRNFPKDWKVETVGDHQLLIRGHKDCPVAEVQIKVGEIADSFAPVVRRQKKDN
jgi:hypothetical protein